MSAKHSDDEAVKNLVTMNPLIKKDRHAGDGTTVATSELVTESDINDFDGQPPVIFITSKGAASSHQGSSRENKTCVYKGSLKELFSQHKTSPLPSSIAAVCNNLCSL